MAKKQKTEAAPVADVQDPTVPIVITPVVASEPLTKSKRKKPATASTSTVADVFARYLAWLEERGGSSGTIASYRMELELAGKALGLDRPIAEVTPELVLGFFTSDAVMRKRNGKARSPLSIDKTRRVLRQALVYAETTGVVAVAPVPELLASH